MIDFVAGTGEADAIDLPGAPAFPVTGDQTAFEAAAGISRGEDCSTQYAGGTCSGYTFADGSELLLQFGGMAENGLRHATWGQRDVLLQLHVIAPTGAPP